MLNIRPIYIKNVKRDRFPLGQRRLITDDTNFQLYRSMVVPKLCEKRQQHANHCSKRIAHLGLGLLPLRYTTAFRVPVHAGVVFVARRCAIFLHGMHSNVPIIKLEPQQEHGAD